MLVLELVLLCSSACDQSINRSVNINFFSCRHMSRKGESEAWVWCYISSDYAWDHDVNLCCWTALWLSLTTTSSFVATSCSRRIVPMGVNRRGQKDECPRIWTGGRYANVFKNAAQGSPKRTISSEKFQFFLRRWPSSLIRPLLMERGLRRELFHSAPTKPSGSASASPQNSIETYAYGSSPIANWANTLR